MLTVGFELEFLISSQVCPTCEGFGCVPCPTCDGEKDVECNECENEFGEEHGKYVYKYVYCPRLEGYYECKGRIDCPDCDGTGELYCPDCKGVGLIPKSRAVVKQLEAHGADVVYDSSVRCYYEVDTGRELRSPVFDFSDKEKLNDFVYTVTTIIKDGGGESSPDLFCGLHVHVRPYTYNGWTPRALKKLYRAWINWAEDLFIEHFCPATWRILDYAYRWKAWLEECDPVERDLVIKGEACPSNNRYMTLNVLSLYDHATIEFRLFDGTLEASEILEAIEWVGTLVEAVLTYEEDGEIKQYFEAQLGIVVQAA